MDRLVKAGKTRKQANEEFETTKNKMIDDEVKKVSRENVDWVTIKGVFDFKVNWSIDPVSKKWITQKEDYDSFIARDKLINKMQNILENKRKEITKNIKAKPPQPTTTAAIDSAVEAKMVPERCKQKQLGLKELKKRMRGWAVRSREYVDFDTLGKAWKSLESVGGPLEPTYDIPKAARKDIPKEVRHESPG